MLDYNKKAATKKMAALTTVQQHEQDNDTNVQSANSKVESARASLAREQQKLDQTPRVVNGQHNKAYGRQINIRDAAKEVVERAEEGLVKAQNDFSRKRYLARLDAERKAEEDARKAEQADHAKEQEETFMASAKSRWLASGGTEASFAENAPSLWTAELNRRMGVVQPSKALAQIQAKIRGQI